MLKYYIKKSLFLLFLGIVILTISCDLFDPRDNEDPVQPAPWISYPVNIEQVLTNIQYSYDYSQNATKYSEVFTTDFTFHFANQDITEHGTPSTMNKSQEGYMLINLHKNISSAGNSIQVTLSPIEGEEDEINSEDAIVYRNYQITIIFGTEIVRYSGKAELHLKFDGRWNISDWFDYRADTNKTWGKLKYEYSL